MFEVYLPYKRGNIRIYWFKEILNIRIYDIPYFGSSDFRYYAFKEEIHKWLEEYNIKYRLWYHDYVEDFNKQSKVIFNNKEDTILFKLTWI